MGEIEQEALAFLIQSGVYYSYLTTTLEENISDLLEEFPTATRPQDLPRGRVRSTLQVEFQRHFHTPCILSPPTIARVLAMGQRRDPSPVELFMATAAVYYGTQQACRAAAPNLTNWTQQFDISPRELVHVLMTMHWSAAGMYEDRCLPTVSFIARVALRRGLIIRAPRSSWPSGPPETQTAPAWSVAYNLRRHVPRDSLMDSFRTNPSHLESFSLWLVNRPLVLAGPFASHSSTFADIFLITLTHERAAAMKTKLSTILAAGYNRWPHDFTQAIVLTENASEYSGTGTSTTRSGGSSPLSPYERP